MKMAKRTSVMEYICAPAQMAECLTLQDSVPRQKITTSWHSRWRCWGCKGCGHPNTLQGCENRGKVRKTEKKFWRLFKCYHESDRLTYLSHFWKKFKWWYFWDPLSVLSIRLIANSFFLWVTEKMLNLIFCMPAIKLYSCVSLTHVYCVGRRYNFCRFLLFRRNLALHFFGQKANKSGKNIRTDKHFCSPNKARGRQTITYRGPHAPRWAFFAAHVYTMRTFSIFVLVEYQNMVK